MLSASVIRVLRQARGFSSGSLWQANKTLTWKARWWTTADQLPCMQGKTQQMVFLSSSAVRSQQGHEHLPHFKTKGSQGGGDEEQTQGDQNYMMAHPIWNQKELENVQIEHKAPETFIDKLAYVVVQTLRISFDLLSFYKMGKMTEAKFLNRIIMLETIAGVPGMIGGMARHLKSLRSLSRDHGWIHTLLEEAENERMHLMTALELKNPGIFFKGLIILSQGVFVNMFFLAYLASPQFCHRLVGYLEEEAVKTYTYCLECIDNGKLPVWQKMAAPPIAVNYWKLKEGATMRDTILVIRADEAHHRLVNHTLGTIAKDAPNPFNPGQKKL